MLRLRWPPIASLGSGVGGFSNNHSSVSVRSGLPSNTEPSFASSSDGCELASDRLSTDPRRRRSPGELRAAMQLPVYTAGPSLAGTKQAADLVGRTSPSCTGGPISRKF